MINEIRMAATPAVNAATPDPRAPGTGEFDDVLRQALPGDPQAPRATADAPRSDDTAPPAKPARAPETGAGVAADGAAAAVAADAADADRQGAATSPDGASGAASATRGRSATPARTTRSSLPPRTAAPPADAAGASQSDAARSILADAARGASLAGASTRGPVLRDGTTGDETSAGDDTADDESDAPAGAGVASLPAAPALTPAPALPVASTAPSATGATVMPAITGATGAANTNADAATIADADGTARRTTGAARRGLPEALPGTLATDDSVTTNGDASRAVPGDTTAQDPRDGAREPALPRDASKTVEGHGAGASDGHRARPDAPLPDAARALAAAPGTNVATASPAPAERRSGPTLESALAALPRALSARGPREAGGPDAEQGVGGGFAGMLASAAWSPPSNAASGADAAPQFPIGTPLSDPQFPGVLSEQVATIALAGLDRAEIQLSPRDLGPIRIELSLSGESASIAFSAALPETRQAIEQSLPTLHTMLADHGIELSQASVGQGRDGGGGSASSYAAGAQSRSASRSAVDPGASAATSIALEPRRSRGLLDLFA